MLLLEALKQEPFLLYDGPMESRIEFASPDAGSDSSVKLEKDSSLFRILYQQAGLTALHNLYEGDIAVAQHFQAPIILNAPTWRANAEHIKRAGYPDKQSVVTINRDAIQFVKAIRQACGTKDIFITAPIGPRLTDYHPDQKTSIEEAEHYHQTQADAIAEVGVDIISIAAMAGMIETIGCARAIAQVGLPYSVGVVLNKNGTLLDGNRFEELILKLDALVNPAPNFYVISCTHSSIAASALSDHKPAYQRILGIKANGSARPLSELIKAKQPFADDPADFAKALVTLGKTFEFKIYGGCCGTDRRHLAALAEALRACYPQKQISV